MPDTLITTIDINQAQTEAWTKRFRVTTRPDPIVVPSAHKLMLLSAKTPVDEELVMAKAQAAVNSWFEQGLLCELCSYIWDSVTGQTPLNFTLTAATQIAAAQDSQPVQSWEAVWRPSMCRLWAARPVYQRLIALWRIIIRSIPQIDWRKR